jgi:hypothetical protein
MLQYADEYVSAMYKEFQTITLKLTKKTENECEKSCVQYVITRDAFKIMLQEINSS